MAIWELGRRDYPDDITEDDRPKLCTMGNGNGQDLQR